MSDRVITERQPQPPQAQDLVAVIEYARFVEIEHQMSREPDAIAGGDHLQPGALLDPCDNDFSQIVAAVNDHAGARENHDRDRYARQDEPPRPSHGATVSGIEMKIIGCAKKR